MKRIFSVFVAVLLIALSAVPVFAAPSPTKSVDYKVYIHNTKGGTGTYTTKKDSDGKHVTFKAHPKNGYEFVKWVIKGDYEIEDGDLTDDEFTLLVNSDIDAYPYYKSEKGDNKSKSSHVSQ